MIDRSAHSTNQNRPMDRRPARARTSRSSATRAPSPPGQATCPRHSGCATAEPAGVLFPRVSDLQSEANCYGLFQSRQEQRKATRVRKRRTETRPDAGAGDSDPQQLRRPPRIERLKRKPHRRVDRAVPADDQIVAAPHSPHPAAPSHMVRSHDSGAVLHELVCVRSRERRNQLWLVNCALRVPNLQEIDRVVRNEREPAVVAPGPRVRHHRQLPAQKPGKQHRQGVVVSDMGVGEAWVAVALLGLCDASAAPGTPLCGSCG